MNDQAITRENAGEILLNCIQAEQQAAQSWINGLQPWKRERLMAGDARSFHPDRLAEARGFVRFSPSVWMAPTRSERNYLSDGIRHLEKNGLVECEKSGNRVIYVRLTNRGKEALMAEKQTAETE